MKIYFGCTTAGLPYYKKDYLAIRELLINDSHVLTRDWLPGVLDDKEHDKKHGSAFIYEATLKAIQEAEVVIIEDTISNFSTGHIITMCLQRRKPVLVMWQKSKNKLFTRTFLHGIKSEYLEIAEYNSDNYVQIIRSFVKKYEHATDRHRFHLVIDEVERKYLDWAQFNYETSRTNIIREAIREKMERDEKYHRYLE